MSAVRSKSHTSVYWKHRRGLLDISHPIVMGILNVTPDSFFDGGEYHTIDAALKQAARMLQEGAHIIDVGGESTRPSSIPVSLQEELDRIIPVIEALRHEHEAVISVDTYKPEVMRAALQAGADIVNDIYALQKPHAIEVVRDLQAGVCLMHMQGTPQTMQIKPHYENVTTEVCTFLMARYHAAIAAGIDPLCIVLDPGFGFGKTLEHNHQLIADLPLIAQLEAPILMGVSRKSMWGDPMHRKTRSIEAAQYAVRCGIKIIRTHDVAETCTALHSIQSSLIH